MRRQLFAVVLGLVVAPHNVVVAQSPALADMRLLSVEDSATYRLYRYVVANPVASPGGVASVDLDVTATPGYGGFVLDGSGAFYDLTSIASPVPVAPFVDVGPSSPSGWSSYLRRTGELHWTASSRSLSHLDSISPGDSLTGFLVRSTYLPGVRTVRVLPTLQACCTQPWGDEITNPNMEHREPVFYAAEGLTVAPRYAAQEVVLTVVQSQLDAVCTDPLWIDDAGLCSQLSDSLDAAETRLANDDVIGARAAVGAAGEIVYANREPFGAIESNAEWLLRLNLAQLLENLPEPSVPIWAAPVTYAVGDEVSYEGLNYRCRRSHTSQSGWEPPNVYALWERINTGGEWAPQVIYQTDDEATYDGTTYRVIQGHQAQVGWEPPNQPALWEEVN